MSITFAPLGTTPEDFAEIGTTIEGTVEDVTFNPDGKTKGIKLSDAAGKSMTFTVRSAGGFFRRPDVKPPNETEYDHGDAVYRAMAALGNTLMQVANTLRDAGIRGRISDSVHCPMAVFIRSLDVVRDNGYMVQVCAGSTRLIRNDRAIVVMNPSPVMDFVTTFDRAKLPTLAL